MDLLNSQYFKINKHALKICGLWPYQSQLVRKINYFIFAIMTFSLIFALASGIQSQLKVELLNTVETFVVIFFCFVGLLKCTILYNQRDQIKKLYEGIAADWEKLTDDLERDILRAFLLKGYNFNFIILVSSPTAFILFICITFLPRIFRESSEYHLLNSFPYYFRPMVIYKNLYDLQICVHLSVGVVYAGLAYLSTSSTYISSVQYVCALYAITRRRLQNAIVRHKNNKQFDELLEDKSVIPRLIQVIDMHKKAIRSGTQIIEKVFNASFFFLEVLWLSFVAIAIFELNYHKGNINKTTRVLLMLPVALTYLYFVHWSGEQVIQSCNDMHVMAYNIEWYRLSSRARIFIVIIMQRTLKFVHLTAGAIIILSMQNFAIILKTAWSLGTILLTTASKNQ